MDPPETCLLRNSKILTASNSYLFICRGAGGSGQIVKEKLTSRILFPLPAYAFVWLVIIDKENNVILAPPESLGSMNGVTPVEYLRSMYVMGAKSTIQYWIVFLLSQFREYAFAQPQTPRLRPAGGRFTHFYPPEKQRRICIGKSKKSICMHLK